MNTSVFMIDGQSLSAHLSDGEFVIRSNPRPYSITWSDESKPGKAVQRILDENPGNLLFIDERVYELYGSEISHPESKIFKAKATEAFKSVEGMLSLVDFLDSHQTTKGDKVVVVGGGIIQDVGAFASAIYKRGIPWVYFPTTLLSQCDSCIGGKSGLNYKNAKNQIALFSAPRQIVINLGFLKTLEPADILSGMGEALKLHITGGPALMESYLHHCSKAKAHPSLNGGGSLDSMKALILGSLSVKRAVIEEDEFELGLRKSMNYGHTLGHAIEALSEYKIPHGLAVVIGLLIVNEFSSRRGWLPANENKAIKALAFDLLSPDMRKMMKDLSVDSLLSLLKKDKKTVGSQVTFVFLHSLGEMRFVPIALDQKIETETREVIKELFG